MRNFSCYKLKKLCIETGRSMIMSILRRLNYLEFSNSLNGRNTQGCDTKHYNPQLIIAVSFNINSKCMVSKNTLVED